MIYIAQLVYGILSIDSKITISLQLKIDQSKHRYFLNHGSTILYDIHDILMNFIRKWYERVILQPKFVYVTLFRLAVC